MSEFLDKSYLLVMNNFVRFGMLLLLIGFGSMIIGIVNKELSNSVSGGFVFLSGIILIVSDPKSTKK